MKSRKEQIKECQERIVALQIIMSDIISECEHKYIKAGDGAKCEECGEYSQSWWCPESPNHLCSYEKYNPDCCDHCGQPEERK